jgi:putative tryptophan/tyrosine transport system substrate-binding protein
MNRRVFIAGLGAAAWPAVVRAQREGKTRPIVGYLDRGSLLTSQRDRPAFVQRRSQLGWIEGRTITIEYRFAEGSIMRISGAVSTGQRDYRLCLTSDGVEP